MSCTSPGTVQLFYEEELELAVYLLCRRGGLSRTIGMSCQNISAVDQLMSRLADRVLIQTSRIGTFYILVSFTRHAAGVRDLDVIIFAEVLQHRTTVWLLFFFSTATLRSVRAGFNNLSLPSLPRFAFSSCRPLLSPPARSSAPSCFICLL